MDRIGLNTITESTVRRALKVIEMAGGKFNETEVIIPLQEPKAWKLEQWNPGVPDKIINTNDAAWQWKGDWVKKKADRHKQTILAKTHLTYYNAPSN